MDRPVFNPDEVRRGIFIERMTVGETAGQFESFVLQVGMDDGQDVPAVRDQFRRFVDVFGVEHEVKRFLLEPFMQVVRQVDLETVAVFMNDRAVRAEERFDEMFHLLKQQKKENAGAFSFKQPDGY
jgi:hypothetical protein